MYPYVWSLLPDTQGSILAGTGHGIYRSSDSGVSWQPLGGFPPILVCRLVFNSRGTVFAATFTSSPLAGVYRSTNGGGMWTQLTDSVAEPLFITLSDVVYSGGNGVLRSTDGGNSWRQIQSGTRVRSIIVADNGTILTGIYSPFYGLMRSSDGGNIWLPHTANRFYPEYFAVNSLGTLFCASDSGMWKSSDNGQSWIMINNGLINSNNRIPHLRTLTRAQNGDLYAGEIATGEVFHSTNEGNSWNRFARIELDTVVLPSRLTSIAFSGNDIFVGSSFDGVYRSTAQGTFERKANGLTNLAVNTIAIGGANKVFVGCSGIFCSTNNGELWTRFGTPSVIVRAITQIGTGEVFAGTGAGVLKFTSDGSSFQLVNNGLTNRSVNALVSSATNQVFAGTDGGLFRLDSSLWVPLSNGVGDVRVTCLALRGSALLAGTQDSAAYVSQDNGEHWRQIAAGLSGQSISDVALASPNKAFAATRGNGVYTSTLDGTTWTRVADGLTDLNIAGIEGGPDSRLYAVSDSGNVHRSSFVDAVELTDGLTPGSYALLQNYPNPFNPSTTINYQLPTNSHVTLKVYDMLGREVATLVNEVQDAGFKSVTFNASNLPAGRQGLASGVYLYRLTAGSFVSTRKMVVVK
jgi:photosystem II stability/assembly factor-like uncharacterized protein